jgi:hypothetical protein
MKIKNEIKSKIKNEVLSGLRRMNCQKAFNIYLKNDIIDTGVKMNAGLQEIDIPKKTAFVLIDEAPTLNWAHPCEHILCDSETGEIYNRIKACFPPAEFIRNPENFEDIHTPVKRENVLKGRKLSTSPIPAITNALNNARGDRYAIFFSGESNNRHVNDMEFLYRTLIDIYGFDANKITVLNHDGTLNYNGGPKPVNNWPGDNTAYQMPVDDEGTGVALENAIDDLKTKLKKDDFLFIHTNNHGYGPPSPLYPISGLCAYNNIEWDEYSSTDFGNKLAELPGFAVLMVMMEQCHSGGFENAVINNSTAKWTHFSAACEEDRNSNGGADFDPFALDWIAAVTGQYADGGALSQVVDTNTDGRISAAEAHTYADDVVVPHWGYSDTPVEAESPAGAGDNIFLGYPAHDLYLRDNLEDHGREPLIDGGISCSPDVIIFNQELLDPEAILGTTLALSQANLGEQVEFGQNNYIYLRVHNRGNNATGGTATVYWSHPSTFPTPASWNLVDQITIPSVPSNSVKVVGPVVWPSDDIPAQGHYCFIALVNSGNDPAPDPATILSMNDFYNFIRENNNATWKNFDVIDMFAGSVNSLNFHIQGWSGNNIYSDLQIDLSSLPTGMEVNLKILKRLCIEASTDGLSKINESTLYNEYYVLSGKKSYLRNIKLKSNDNCIAKLEFILPDSIPDGGYEISVAQLVDNLEMGRVTQLLAVGEHPFIANKNTKELHNNNCKWVKKMNNKNKIAYKEIPRAIKHNYNGCRYCLPDYDTD